MMRKSKPMSKKSLEAMALSSNSENEAKSCTNNCGVMTSQPCMERCSSSNTMGQTLMSLDSLVAICTSDRCKLDSWSLPPTILCKYKSQGITRMFPWQVDCLMNRELLVNNRNLVFSAPTSAGKTLVAEILVIKTVIERRKKVIFILPFVSLVREKMYHFQNLFSDSGIRVEGYMGGCSPAGGFDATDIAIATIERANSLLNQLLGEGNLECLGMVVIDELHLIGDPHRGYLLELSLTKLKYMTLREETIHVQLIGMSATLPNLDLLAKWLDAALYTTEFRPIPLEERCKIGRTIYNNRLNVVRELPSLSELNADTDNILQLCIETIADGKSVLIFCPTKDWCEKLAHQIALIFNKLGHDNTPLGNILREQLSTEAIVETMEQLKRVPSGLDKVLRSTVSFGVAFHHAGLTIDERDVIEGAFRTGSLRVLTATSTLSSGINLPARRVIIRSLMYHGKLLDILTYKQMIGRAGRMGKDTQGESILICKSNETKSAKILLSSNLPPVTSCLNGPEPLIRALLEAVASEVAYKFNDIELYTKCTLLSHTTDSPIDELANEGIKYLIDNELLMLQTSTCGDNRWVATQLGKACLAASMPPHDALFIFQELQKARRCLILDTELHIIYLVTPLNSSTQIGQIDWLLFLDLWKKISESERRVGHLVGVDENFLISGIRGTIKNGKVLNVHKRFYTALVLHELVREVPFVEVCRKYGCCRGVVQSLQQSAASFAGMLTQFCKKLGWNCMELLIGQFQARLQFGVHHELLDLLRLPMLNGLRARSLYKEGITCVAKLALANELDVERALHKALPFESGKEHDDEDEYDAARRNKMRCVFVTGRDGLTPQEAARILVQEARILVQNELGVDEVQWKQRESLTTTGSILNQMSNISEKQNAISIGLSKIGNVAEEIQDHSGNDSEIKDKNVCVYERSLPDDSNNPGIVETVKVQCEKHSNETIGSNATRLPIDDNHCNSPAIFTKNSVEFTSPRNTFDQIEINELKFCEGVTFNTINSKSAIDLEKITDGSKSQNEIPIEGSLDFVSFGNTVNMEEAIIGAKISNQISFQDAMKFSSNENVLGLKVVTNESNWRAKIFEITSNRNAVNQTLTTIDLQTDVEICNKEINKIAKSKMIFETKAVTIESKTDEEIFNEHTFEFMNSVNDIDSKVLTIESITGENINNKNNNELMYGGNVLDPKVITIGSKTGEEICNNIFELTFSENVIDPKVSTTESIATKTLGVEDFLEYTIHRDANRPTEDAIVSTISEEMFKDASFGITSTENVIDPTNLNAGSKTRVQIPLAGIFDIQNAENTNSEKNVATKFATGQKSGTGKQKVINESEAENEIFKNIIDSTSNIKTNKYSKKFNKCSAKISVINSAPLLQKSVTEDSHSQIPSMFDDSFNLDTQECNILEQNVIDSINMSSFDETNISGFVESQGDPLKNRICNEARTLLQSSPKNQRKYSLKNTSLRRSPRISRLKSKNSFWEDDSRNYSDSRVALTNNMLNTAISSKVINMKEARVSETASKPKNKIEKKLRLLSYDDRLTPKKRSVDLKKIPQKRKLSESSIERSIEYTEIRNKTIKSNKTHSDAIVLPSQSITEMVNLTTNRPELELESLKKAHPQQRQSTDKINMVASTMKENYDDNGLCGRCSIENVLNSQVKTSIKHMNGPPRTKTIKPIRKSPISKKKLIIAEGIRSDETKRKKQQTCQQEMEVVHVATDRAIFDQFKRDVTNRTDIALALACEKYNKEAVSIGTKIIGIKGINSKKRTRKIENCVHENKKICGVAVTWDGIVVYYMSFENINGSKVSVKERLDFLVNMLSLTDLTVRCFSFKEIYKILYNCCSIASSCKFLDPKTADWLLNVDHSERGFNVLIADYFAEAQFMLQRVGPHFGRAGPGLNIKSTISSEIRATTESALTWSLTNILITKLAERNPKLLETFRDIEMATLTILARMELTGMGVNFEVLQELSDVVQQEMKYLENKAFSLAGKKFNFSSSKNVAQILGLYKGRKVSTNKVALGHCVNPISNLVVAWRKLSATQIKMVFPLLRLAEYNSRIHGNCVTNTVTGRVSMHEPNLQNVPKDFNSLNDRSVISIRKVFVPVHGNVILSADYCQLELRILAHFSNEPNLCRILQNKGDIFTNIAARWSNVPEEQINESMRQRTKQLCYGMIYGMGVKTLAETLSVTETEAKRFLETFMGAYPGIRPWLSHVIENARTNGYATTLLQRRRFFPSLNSKISSERSQAERQAINTKIQGSAADIVKTAMVKIDERIRREFSESPLVLKDGLMKRKLRSCTCEPMPRGGYLILQIHDELLYEVNAMDLHQVGRIIKESMEKSYELRVPLPVKLKVGSAWGDLTEENFESF